MFQTVLVLARIFCTVWPRTSAEAFSFVVFEVSFVNHTTDIDFSTLSVGIIVSPVTLMRCTVRFDKETFALAYA